MNTPIKSKINWTAGILALLGVLTDPKILGLIPEKYASKIMIIAGALLIIWRSFFTETKAQEPVVTP